MQTTKSTFGKEFTKLFRKTLKQRHHLLRTGKSQASEARMRMHMDKLYPYMHTNFSDRGAAKFLIENQYIIGQIIPAHQHQMKIRLHSLVMMAKQYTSC
jgi:hypothetical protein